MLIKKATRFVFAASVLALGLPLPITKADLVLGFSTSGSVYLPPPLVSGVPTYEVLAGGTVDLHLFLLQTAGGGTDNNGAAVDLTSDPLATIGVRVQYTPNADSASITATAALAPFTDSIDTSTSSVSGYGQVISNVPVINPSPTGAAFPLGTFTFQAGTPGNTTAVMSAVPVHNIITDFFLTDTSPIHILDNDAYSPAQFANISTVPEPPTFGLFCIVVMMGIGMQRVRLLRKSSPGCE